MKFRKKPVVIEAERFYISDGGNESLPLPFSKDGVCCFDSEAARWYVQTLEGPLTISQGDWIIRGVKGEYYPCKPDIFDATYEPVEEGREVNIRIGVSR